MFEGLSYFLGIRLSIHLLRYSRRILQYIPQFLEVSHNFRILFCLKRYQSVYFANFSLFLSFFLYKYQSIQCLATCSIFRNFWRSSFWNKKINNTVFSNMQYNTQRLDVFLNFWDLDSPYTP